MSAHANCTHPKTKSARAACRRAVAKGAPVAPKVAPLPTEIQTPIAPTHTIREVTDVTVREIALRAQIDSYQLEMTREKIDKINQRAVKKGLAGMITMTVEPVQVSEVNEFTKITETWTEYKVEVTGHAPAYNGWEFIAKLDWDENAGLIVRNIPGVDSVVNRETVKEGWCDHCQTTRRRNVTYVVRNQESGETLQVGSSCLKDFTGQFTSIAFPQLSADDESEGGFFGGRGEREFSPLTVLAVAWACIKLEGFKPASQHYGSNTRDDVRTALYPSKSRLDREWAAKIAPLADEAQSKAAEILAFTLSDDFRGDSDYVLNLKAVAAGKAVSRRNIGLLASAPQAYARHQERSLIREREASIYKDSQYVGAEKERLELTVEVKAIRYLESDYGSKTLYTMVTEDGNVVKWFASSERLGENVGARFKIRATVKSHDEWEGMKTTKLTRCSVIDELEPAGE
jgi:hypothetical protein